MEKLYYPVGGGPGMDAQTLRKCILYGEQALAHMLVCMYITRRTLKALHVAIIEHEARARRTLDLAPRGFGKSTVGDVDYCIMRILRNPNIRILIGSKTQGQAEAFLNEVKMHFEQNEILREIFGDWVSRNWNTTELVVNRRTEIKKEATLTALGASGAVISKHFDIIIGDDLVGFENARTEGQRSKLKEWFYTALVPTLEPEGELHILGTRYHPLELYQSLIDSGNYTVQVQSAITKKQGKDSSLWRDKFPLKLLRQMRAEAGSIIFSMQFQNDVELAKGTIFKAKDFRHYERWQRINPEGGEAPYIVAEVLDANGRVRQKRLRITFGVDLAIGENTQNDYFVLMVLGGDDEGNIYVLEYLKDRLSFKAQVDTIIAWGKKFPMVERVAIESVAYQRALPQELRRMTYMPIVDIQTSKDKVSRGMRRSALFEAHRVFFLVNQTELEEQLILFPDVEHDDLFDALDFGIDGMAKVAQVNVLDRSLFRI